MVTNYDINGDGVDELVTGWTSGKVDIRSPDTGQILFKDVFSSPVAGITKVKFLMHLHVQYNVFLCARCNLHVGTCICTV